VLKLEPGHTFNELNMSEMNMAPQLDRLLSQLENLSPKPVHGALASSTRLMSVMFGFKLVELSLVSLTITARTKGLLPAPDVINQSEGLIGHTETLYRYGLLTFESYERLLRIENFRIQCDAEFSLLSSKLINCEAILEDISQVLQSTEEVVQEFCQPYAHANSEHGASIN